MPGKNIFRRNNRKKSWFCKPPASPNITRSDKDDEQMVKSTRQRGMHRLTSVTPQINLHLQRRSTFQTLTASLSPRLQLSVTLFSEQPDAKCMTHRLWNIPARMFTSFWSNLKTELPDYRKGTIQRKKPNGENRKFNRGGGHIGFIMLFFKKSVYWKLS